MKYTDVEIMYTAFIGTDQLDGFLDIEYGQGECLVFTVDDLEDATYFSSKEEILELLKEERVSLKTIHFCTRKKTVITEYERIYE